MDSKWPARQKRPDGGKSFFSPSRIRKCPRFTKKKSPHRSPPERRCYLLMDSRFFIGRLFRRKTWMLSWSRRKRSVRWFAASSFLVEAFRLCLPLAKAQRSREKRLRSLGPRGSAALGQG